MITKTVYLFDESTGVFKGIYEAHESPEEPGVYITPVHSTEKPLPEFKADETALFQNGYWVVVPIPSDPAIQPHVPTIEEVQADKIAEMRIEYQNAIQQSVAYKDTTFQADTASQDLLSKALCAGKQYAPPFWQDVNNQQITMTFAELQGLAGAMIAQGQLAFVNLQMKKVAAKAATTIADVQAITW